MKTSRIPAKNAPGTQFYRHKRLEPPGRVLATLRYDTLQEFVASIFLRTPGTPAAEEKAAAGTTTDPSTAAAAATTTATTAEAAAATGGGLGGAGSGAAAVGGKDKEMEIAALRAVVAAADDVVAKIDQVHAACCTLMAILLCYGCHGRIAVLFLHVPSLFENDATNLAFTP